MGAAITRRNAIGSRRRNKIPKGILGHPFEESRDFRPQIALKWPMSLRSRQIAARIAGAIGTAGALTSGAGFLLSAVDLTAPGLELAARLYFGGLTVAVLCFSAKPLLRG
ncbi:hypothetical protein [Phreatobacter stygius]|uniref:Uncharacterized protein n=1 Tax=Phreatobacter stygius TaxID=1940610 RepID=A0A4D7B867_9HYPH|nr:hypothetical protein [Phreatobacter stygius]QCI64177.1 hypothetical protein E8M01_07915 [Phreatobacter stygius]